MEIGTAKKYELSQKSIVETVHMGQKYSLLAGHMPPAIVSIFNPWP